MEEPLKKADQMEQVESRPSTEDPYYQRLKNTDAIWQLSHQETWELYQELQAHHDEVQTRYEALAEAMNAREDRRTLWEEYHQAVKQHRLLVNRFRLAMQQRLLILLHKQDQSEQP